MINMRVLLNAIIAKKKSGGGFQIALNFFNATLCDTNIVWHYIISEDLSKSIDKSLLLQDNIHVFPNQPDIRTFKSAQKRITDIESEVNPDVVYSVLAPSYFTFRKKEIMRCANAWAVNSSNSLAFNSLPLKTKLFFAIKGYCTRFFMRKTSYFITQSETGKKGIVNVTNTQPDNIGVIPNVLPLKYKDVELNHHYSSKFRIVYVAASQPHKDHLIIPKVANLLYRKYGLNDFEFIVTLSEKDKKFLERFQDEAKRYSVESFIRNVGYKTQDQLIELYSDCDLGFFPSLLETFSATLLEYMYFELPIVASDFEFNSEVAQEAALYFDPHNAEDAALAILSLYKDKDLFNKQIEHERKRILQYSDYSMHYKKTIDFLMKIANKSVT